MRNDDADQKAHQTNDGKRRDPHLLHLRDQSAIREPGRADGEIAEADHLAAQRANHARHTVARFEDLLAQRQRDAFPDGFSMLGMVGVGAHALDRIEQAVGALARAGARSGSG